MGGTASPRAPSTNCRPLMSSSIAGPRPRFGQMQATTSTTSKEGATVIYDDAHRAAIRSMVVGKVIEVIASGRGRRTIIAEHPCSTSPKHQRRSPWLTRSDSTIEKEYHTHKWRKYRERFLWLHPLCVSCGQPAKRGRPQDTSKTAPRPVLESGQSPEHVHPVSQPQTSDGGQMTQGDRGSKI